MHELALFAGAGGGILGGHLLGWRTVCAVEWDPYAASVLAARQNDGLLPPFPIWDDVRTFDGRPWRGVVDVVSGGFPCQDISGAGDKAGIEGGRSGLWREMARVVCEVRPRFVFVENSAIITARGLGRVLGDLASIGYDARWDCIPAAQCGTPHFRDRAWIVAYSHGSAGPQQNIGSLQPEQRTSRRSDADGLALAQRRAGEAKAVFRRMDDGLAGRMDRLRAAGNGQVPEAAAHAWRCLMNDTEARAA